MEKWESTGKRVENLFIKKRLDSEDGYLGMYLSLWKSTWKRTENTDLPEYWKKGNQSCIKKDSKPDAGWNHTGLRRKYHRLSDG